MDGRSREMAMKNFLAIGLACCIPLGLAAEDPSVSEDFLGSVNVLVIDEPAPLARDVLCARAGDKAEVTVLTAEGKSVDVTLEGK